MIGGNAYFLHQNGTIDFNVDAFPDAELFVRWSQVTAFMPSMQFSIRPWLYNQSVNEICKETVRIHEEIVFPYLDKYANKSLETGEPIIRPIWWIDNSDSNTYTIDDQFLVGDDILVAPVLKPNSIQREIYLPKGVWVYSNGTFFTGPLRRNFSAPLNHVPFFIRSQ
jgi:myogenesis-regulating glycosidase